MKSFVFWDHKWALALTAPVLLALSFPPFNASILQIPAFVLLLRLAVICNTKRQTMFYAYPAFVLWNLFSTYWLMMATVAGGLAAIIANAAIMLIPLLIMRQLFLSRKNLIFAAFIAATAWVSYEYLHHRWDLAWPWLTLGNGWANLTGAIQYITYTGVLGISFWVVFTASLIFAYLNIPSKKHLYSAIAIFFAFPLFSVLSMINLSSYSGNPVNVAVVQPNSDSYQRYGGLPSLNALLDHLLTLSDEARTENTDVIIWPENALDTSLTINSPYFERIRDSLAVWDTKLITGSGLFEFYEEDDRPAVTRQTTDGRFYNVFNAAVFLQPDDPSEIYRKGRLVPIVERFPFVEFFQRIDIFNWINWGDIMGYGLGTTTDQFVVADSKTPALICYDSVFPNWVNRFVQEGAGFLTIITNDGWWGDSHGHIQHFAFARLRAIEHRMWIARSANNGISGIISPDGKVQVETEYWTEAAFPFTIYHSEKRTFYSRHGDWIGALSLISLLLGLIFLKFAPKSKPPQIDQ
ncbi:MAG: apolipoprotein N-acyltransferase [Balneolaceae bacterium]|nr:MAG: apolipoprotein N-acyltransferase [Balneolaceae bacterium]